MIKYLFLTLVRIVEEAKGLTKRQAINAVLKWPVAVVVEFVVAGVGQMDPEAGAAGVEDLDRRVDPDGGLGQDLEVRHKVILRNKGSTWPWCSHLSAVYLGNFMPLKLATINDSLMILAIIRTIEDLRI